MTDASFALRPVVETDLPHFFAHATDPEAIARVMPASETVDWPAFREKWRRNLANPQILARTLARGDDVAGYLGFFELLGQPSVGYWFGRAYWGRGLATWALARFLEEISPRPVHARVAATNRASLRVLEANGFQPIDRGRYFSPPFGRDIEEVVLRLDG